MSYEPEINFFPLIINELCEFLKKLNFFIETSIFDVTVHFLCLTEISEPLR